MSELSREAIEHALDQIIDPHLESSLVAAKTVRDIRIDGGSVAIDLELPYPLCPLQGGA